MKTEITATFKRERACKHSVRFTPADETAETTATVLYFKNEVLQNLGNPPKLILTLKPKTD